jgi:hypothetical protein
MYIHTYILQAAYFGPDDDDEGSVLKRGPFKIKGLIPGGPPRVDAVFGPVCHVCLSVSLAVCLCVCVSVCVHLCVRVLA